MVTRRLRASCDDLDGWRTIPCRWFAAQRQEVDLNGFAAGTTWIALDSGVLCGVVFAVDATSWAE